jgi:nucleoside-diphosphate-sugar epimerase
MNLVIIGYGYSSAAIARNLLPGPASLHVTARTPEKIARLRTQGLNADVFDGEVIAPGLRQALQAATHLLISAPPGETGDPLLNAPGFSALAMPALTRIIYLSTVGVYGDHAGAWVNEAAVLRPVSLRSRQRVAAEAAWQDFAGMHGIDLGIFRLSGIYGPGRSAIDNLRAGTARRIVKPGQVFNRIHVDDIGAAVATALAHPEPLGVFNLTDHAPCPPQDVVTHAAGLLGVDPPPEIPFEKADLSPMGRSFYGENKRVSNARIRRELGYAFRYPSFREGLAACL